MSEAEIIEVVKSSMSEKRFRHTEGCVKMAEALAKRWGEDVLLARRAAFLHDIAKEIPYDEQLSLIAEAQISLTALQSSKKLIHAFSGAIIAERDFGECEEVCGAIRWHTTARRGMTKLEKIIWLSDLCEEGRTFDGAEKIRELAKDDLTEALILGFNTTLSFLIEQGSEIESGIIEARNFEIAARREKMCE